GEEEAQGTDGLVELTPGGALAEQVQLEVADVLGAEQVGGAGEVLGETGQVVNVGFDGPWCVVAQTQVGDEALAKRGHGVILGRIVITGATVATDRLCRKDGSRSRRAQVPKWEKVQKNEHGTIGSQRLDHREAVSFNLD